MHLRSINGLHSGGLNPGPLGHESSALSTRQRLLALVCLKSVMSHQIVDDNVRSPEVIDHVAANVDLSGRPVGRAVQDHPRLRPHQLVGPANADLLETIGTNIFVN